MLGSGQAPRRLSALALAGTARHRRHMRRIAEDPGREALEHPLAGQPVSVRSADGTQLHVEVFWPPDGQTVVLVHGWTEMLTFWVYVIRQLAAAGPRVVAYDLRGHGHSEPAAAGDYKLAGFGNTGVGDLIAEQLLIPVPPLVRALSNTIGVRGFLGARASAPFLDPAQLRNDPLQRLQP